MQKHKAIFVLKERLEKIGFSVIESPKHNNSSYFMRQEDGVRVYIHAGEIIGVNKFHSIGSWIGIDRIENPILQIMGKYDTDYQSSMFRTVRLYKLLSPTPEVRRRYQEAIDIELDSNSKIEYVINGVLEYIYKVHKPLWEKYSNLQVINDDLIEKIPQMQLANYISSPMPLKKLMIMKYCNNPKYEEYKNWVYEIIGNNIEVSPDQFESKLQIFKDLCEYLEDGLILDNNYTSTTSDKYLENIDNEQVQENEHIVVKPIQASPQLPPNIAVEQFFDKYEKEFKALGIHFDKRNTMNDYRNDANWQSWGMEEPNNIDWKYYLLLFAGTSVYHSKSEKYQLVSPNVYYFNAEWDGFVDYAEIIERLNLLTGNQLPITNLVCEVEGICSFSYKGEEYEWKFQVRGDWTDPEIFESFIALIKPDLKKEFYIMEEGQGGIIVYYSPEEKSAFEQYFNKNLERDYPYPDENITVWANMDTTKNNLGLLVTLLSGEIIPTVLYSFTFEKIYIGNLHSRNLGNYDSPPELFNMNLEEFVRILESFQIFIRKSEKEGIVGGIKNFNFSLNDK